MVKFDMKKAVFLFSFLICFFASSAIGETRSDPVALLQGQTEKVLTELNKDSGAIRGDLNALLDMVERLIVPLIDVTGMSKLVLGKHWKTANEEQREKFQEAFKTMLKNTYTKSLKQYANQNIKYLEDKTEIKDNYATVYSEFVPGSGQENVAVTYSLRQIDGEWKAFNLKVGGLSFVKNYRADFGREIEATSLDALIARLESTPQ